MKNKHNKKKNTMFIYECAIRELANLGLNKQKAKAVALKEAIGHIFSSKTILGQELLVYRDIFEASREDGPICEQIINEAKKHYDVLNLEKLAAARREAISKMSKISPDFLDHFIPNYRNLASIYQTLNFKGRPKERILLERRIIEQIKKGDLQATGNLLPKDDLTLKTFIGKFNEKYGGLLEEQKNLIQKFVFLFESRNLEFKIHLNEEIGRIKKELLLYKSDNSLVMERISQIVDLLAEFSKKAEVDEKDIVFILKTQDLAREIKNA